MKQKNKVRMAVSVIGMAICCLWGCNQGGSRETDVPQQDWRDETRGMTGEEMAWDRGEILDMEEALEDEPDYRTCASGTVVEETLALEETGKFFWASPIPEEVFARMNGISYVENSRVSLEELRYLRLLYVGFDGKTHVGELVAHESVSESLLAIFRILYDSGYPIEKMCLIDDYGGDDEASMRDNNTSAFSYRNIRGSETLSSHARGLAIDINPRYNPYVADPGRKEGVLPAGSEPYAERGADFPYQIGGEEDLCLRLFRDWGFTWGGDWSAPKDYQHFEMPE